MALALWIASSGIAGAEETFTNAAELAGRKAVPPTPITRPAPIYPMALVLAGLEGQVWVDFVITKDGTVSNPVVSRSNNPWFERGALDTILKWKFKPGTIDGQPVNTRASQLLMFEIPGGGQSFWRVRKGKEFKQLPPEFQWSKAPSPVATSLPVFPRAALEARQKGKVKALFVVDPQGKVGPAEIVEATAPELGAAVLAMLDTWAFSPALKADQTPCFAGLVMEFNFEPRAGRGNVPVSDEMLDVLDQLETPGKIVRADELDAVPRPVSRRPPVYPSALRASGKEGEAVVEFFIDRRGDVQLPQVISATAPEFGYAAVQAIAAWRYEPPRKKGKPCTMRAQIALGFELKPEQVKNAAPAK